ncbi:putative lipid II flippase FtsW [Brevibacillus dissolubilis]|uniref:putative lipid II flippase FtsW n=1 Tax=Brevibacillus dissolubilis TaxID=1844116 RepID=UPI0011167A6A|nr:putative lipid II flippase FtsW [Brevibacillus dissolubilis]
MKSRGVPDFLLLILAFLLVGFGITMVISSSYIYASTGIYTFKGCPTELCGGDGLYFAKKQIMWAIMGLVGMLFAMNVPFAFYKKRFFAIGFTSILILLMVLIPGIGNEANGARSWIKIGPMSLQTSEFAKLGLILYLSAIVARKGDQFRDFKKGLIPPLVITALFFILVALQPDLGTAAIMLGTAGVILVAGGARLSHLFILTVPPFGLIVTTYILTKDHALSRVLSYTDPWNDMLGSDYHLVQSFFAIARGGMFGSGFGQSLQKYLYLPEAHTDFIFSVIAEELGFLGTCLFLLIYIAFLLRGIFICLKSQDTFASLAGVGIVAMIGIQAMINIGGVTGTIPITGVPLPFVSYGGSSLLVCMIGTGILLSASREVNKQKTVGNNA